MMGRSVLVDGVEVADVLVEPGLSKEATQAVYYSQPMGARVDYTLTFRADAEPPLFGQAVEVDGNVLDVLNVPAHLDPSGVFGGMWTNPYDMTVLVGRSMGDYTDTVAIVALTATVDALGDPVESESTVYEGPAQARMAAGGESGGRSLETDATERWMFVVPWREAFAGLRPQSTFVDRAGARYGVVSITDVANRGRSACFEAVRRG